MNYSNAKKRKIVRDDYDAIADTYANCYSQIDYCKKFLEEFISSLNGKKVLFITII